MSKETLNLMLGLNRSELEIQISLQCAPLLTGCKISNLLTTDRSGYRDVLRLFRGTGISCVLLYQSAEKITFLLYRAEELRSYLNQPSVKKLMIRFGCEGMKLGEILNRVAGRYQKHMEEKGDFPHEIGLLLGYPPEDVDGFIVNKGQNFLYTGYWKVYSDVEERKAVFTAYDNARERVIHLVSEGMDVRSIIHLYHPEGDKMAV